MYSRRKEGFRYPFEPPLSCSFQIIKIDHIEKESAIGQAQIADISPNGFKLLAPLNIPIENRAIEIKIRFIINTESLTLTGRLIVKYKEYNGFSYGAKLTINEPLQRKLIDELKMYAKRKSGIRRTGLDR